MDTPTPERTSRWAAFKEKHQVAPPESFDSWKPRSVSPAVSQNTRRDNRFLTLLSVFAVLIGTFLRVISELIPEDRHESEETNSDDEYAKFVALYYDN